MFVSFSVTPSPATQLLPTSAHPWIHPFSPSLLWAVQVPIFNFWTTLTGWCYQILQHRKADSNSWTEGECTELKYRFCVNLFVFSKHCQYAVLVYRWYGASVILKTTLLIQHLRHPVTVDFLWFGEMHTPTYWLHQEWSIGPDFCFPTQLHTPYNFMAKCLCRKNVPLAWDTFLPTLRLYDVRSIFVLSS